MVTLLKASAVAVIAALAVSTAAGLNNGHQPIVIVHGGHVVKQSAAPTAKPTAKPTPKPTPIPAVLVGVDAVCRVETKKCCWEPYLCGAVHKAEELTVVVDCHKAVLVETSCTLPNLPHGVHEVVEEEAGEAADLDATERLNGKAVHHHPKVPTKCYQHKKVAHSCHKPVTVTKSYPKVCYKKKCVKTVTPKEFKSPSKFVGWAHGTEVPQEAHQW